MHVSDIRCVCNHVRHSAIVLLLASAVLCAQPSSAPSFEVASIRPHEGPLSRIADFSISGPRVTYGGYNASLLILEAYSLRNFQLATASQKLPLYDYYEIAAVAPGSASITREESRRMLQSLLADRFKLQFHRETREIPVYELMLDKNGASLKPSAGDKPCASRIGPVQPQDRNYRYQFTNCSLDRLVNSLPADRPILDKTGLGGRFDITFFVTPEFKLHDSSEPGDISVLDAVRQFGLRLEARKEQIEVLVVDHVEKPSEN
jgi:uncharacterized protein (TIGR03435 family)